MNKLKARQVLDTLKLKLRDKLNSSVFHSSLCLDTLKHTLAIAVVRL